MLSREALRHIRRLEIRTRRSVASVLSGQYRSVFRGKGMEFADLRPYAYGDDVKTIHWNVTARTGSPHVKLFDEERELVMLIAVDVSASEQFGSRERTKNEVAAEIAAFLAFSAGVHHDNVGLVLFTDAIEHFVPPRKGRRHALRIVRDILNFRPASRRTNLDYALRFCRKAMKKRGIVFILSDFLDENFEKSLTVLARKHDTVGIRITDPRESAIPDVGRVLVEDAETDRTREIDTSVAKNRERMREAAAGRGLRVEIALKKAGLDVIPLSSDESVFPPLLDFFKRRVARLRHN